MRLRFLFPLVLALVLVACGDEPSTIIAGDDTSDAAMEEPAVADDSSPVAYPTTTEAPESLELPLEDEYPTTTAAWESTLEEYPLLQHLSDPPGSGTGSARFVQVDIDGNLMPSGSDEFPHFMITIDSWIGTNNYIEFTISTTNVELVDGQPERMQCANNWAWLSQPEPGRYLRLEAELPEVRGTELVWSAEGCAEDLPIANTSIFDDELGIKVTETGLVMNSLTSRPYWFMRLDSAQVQNPTVTTLVDIPETTVPQTTTTEAN